MKATRPLVALRLRMYSQLFFTGLQPDGIAATITPQKRKEPCEILKRALRPLAHKPPITPQKRKELCEERALRPLAHKRSKVELKQGGAHQKET